MMGDAAEEKPSFLTPTEIHYFPIAGLLSVLYSTHTTVTNNNKI